MEHEEKKRRSFEDGSREVIGALVEVHRELGPGLLENAYEACLCRELDLRGLRWERQRPVPVHYKGISLDLGYRLDVVVEGRVIVELKTTDGLTDVHVAQLITYLKLTGIPVGLLVNFNVRRLRDGLKRLWLDPPPFFSSPLRVPPNEGSS